MYSIIVRGFIVSSLFQLKLDDLEKWGEWSCRKVSRILLISFVNLEPSCSVLIFQNIDDAKSLRL